jgi:hypothetical protein
MPHYIPNPIPLTCDEQLPVGLYDTYLPFYDKGTTGTRKKVSFKVLGHTKAGAMKLEVLYKSDRPKLTRKRKDCHFTIECMDGMHSRKQVTEVYPHHDTIEVQKEREKYEAVEGEIILYHPNRVNL